MKLFKLADALYNNNPHGHGAKFVETNIMFGGSLDHLVNLFKTERSGNTAVVVTRFNYYDDLGIHSVWMPKDEDKAT